MELPPRITVTFALEPLPALPSLDDPAVTLWRDRAGELCAVGHEVAGRTWIHVPSVASFSFDPCLDTVTAVPHAHAELKEILDQFARTVRPMVLHLRGYQVLHASALQVGRGVIALCAPSETGKSTLAYGLNQRGYPLWADDAVVWKHEQSAVRTLPLPFELRLRPASARYFGHSADEASERWRGARQQAAHALPLVALYCLQQLPSASDPVAAITPLAPTQALAQLVRHALYLGLHDATRKRAMMQQYLALAQRTPVFEVRFARGLDKLPFILDALEHHLTLAASPAPHP